MLGRAVRWSMLLSLNLSAQDPTNGAALTNDFDKFLRTRHFADLDGLRFICISLVLWHHAQPVSREALQLFNRGFLGVDFFFVLSGFLITTLLLRERARKGTFSLKNFYIRRALRILPVYFFVVCGVTALYVIIKGETQYLKLFPYHLLFLTNFMTESIPGLGITWSLSVEEQYYLIWPLALLLVPRRTVPIALLALITINYAVSGGLFTVGTLPEIGALRFHLPNSTYAPILLGSLLAITLNDRRTFEALSPVLLHPAAAVAGMILVFLSFQLTPENILGWPNTVIHLAMTFALGTLVVQDRTALSPVLTQPLIARVGQISYGIYLYHLLGLDVATRLLDALGQNSAWGRLIIYSLISILFAEISYRTLEAFFRKFRPQS